MQALEHRNVDTESIEAEAKTEQRHHERRAYDVPAVEVSSAHAWTLAAWPASVSPFSDVIVLTAPRETTVCVVGSRYREQSARPRCQDVRSRADRARPSVRRVVLHWRVDYTNLLPPDLSGEACQVAQRRLLPHRGCRRARGFPSLLAVSTGNRTRDAGVAGFYGDSHTRTAAHRARISGRWQARRRSRRYTWDDDPTSAPTLRAARRCVADRGRNDPARSVRETVGGRDDDADVLDRVCCRVRERPAIQRCVSRS